MTRKFFLGLSTVLSLTSVYANNCVRQLPVLAGVSPLEHFQPAGVEYSENEQKFVNSFGMGLANGKEQTPQVWIIRYRVTPLAEGKSTAREQIEYAQNNLKPPTQIHFLDNGHNTNIAHVLTLPFGMEDRLRAGEIWTDIQRYRERTRPNIISELRQSAFIKNGVFYYVTENLSQHEYSTDKPNLYRTVRIFPADTAILGQHIPWYIIEYQSPQIHGGWEATRTRRFGDQKILIPSEAQSFLDSISFGRVSRGSEGETNWIRLLEIQKPEDRPSTYQATIHFTRGFDSLTIEAKFDGSGATWFEEFTIPKDELKLLHEGYSRVYTKEVPLTKPAVLYKMKIEIKNNELILSRSYDRENGSQMLHIRMPFHSTNSIEQINWLIIESLGYAFDAGQKNASPEWHPSITRFGDQEALDVLTPIDETVPDNHVEI
ncbi:MAG: hypothetical protein JWQ35_258 [Bacteriovoracaceae bacterium]|nr:hypothetical protein [Bacteriovoracaceae bacterium]